jgi:phosphonate transport system substrate-binding protein
MDRITFGIGPVALGEGGAEIRERFAKLLATALDMRVTLVTARSYQRLLSRCMDGEVDVAWLPPALYARLDDQADGTRLLLGSERMRPGPYRGALFVREDSEVLGLDDLAGKAVGWVDPVSCAGYLFPRFALLEKKVQPDKLFGEERFLRSHEAVVRAVMDEVVDVGATYLHLDGPSSDASVLSSGFTDFGERGRIILKSRTIPVDVVAAMKSLSPSLEARVVEGLSRVHEQPNAGAALRDLLQIQRFVAADPKDYDVVRAALNVAHLPILGR